MFLEESLAILARTPAVMDAMLRGLPEAWITAKEGPGTWTPRDVMGHLVHTERVDWLVRLGIILEHGPSRPFDPLDREAQFRGEPQPMDVLLDEFAALRRASVDQLRAMNLTGDQLALEGTHPTLGPVTARQLVAAWVGHDFTHIVQVSRVMAKRYKLDAGPWTQYLSVMGDRS